MSVILQALQRARKDGRTPPDGPYAGVPGPMQGGPVQSGRNLALVFGFFAVVVILILVICGTALWIVLSRLQPGMSPMDVLKTSAVAPTPAGSGVPGLSTGHGNARHSPAGESSLLVPEAQYPRAPGQAAQPYARDVLPVSSPAIGGDGRILGAAELPPPVPISQLNSNTASDLPPPPTDAGSNSSPKSKTGAPIRLGTVLCEQELCIAIIDGRGVRAGQTVSGYTVVRITPEEVVIQRPGEKPITLYPGQK